MSDPDLIGLFLTPLERLGLSYMVTGGVASVVYGDPRFTRDVDVVLELGPGDLGGLISAFPPGDFYVPPREALADEVAREEGGHFNLIHRETALRADVYLAGSDPLHAWAMEGRRRIRVGNLAIWLAPVEYVILRKLEYFCTSGSERHLRDVAMMLRVSEEEVDADSLEMWTRRLGLEEQLERARRFDPER